MDTLRSNMTKKYFNTLMSIGNIAKAYKNNKFPDAYCMMTTSLEEQVAIATEYAEILNTESRKVVLRDGSTSFRLH